MQLHCAMLVAAMLVTSSRSYPNGFPMSVCKSMFPHHGATPQTSTPPYSITVNATTYTPGSGQAIAVTVTSQGTGFKGLSVQMRSLSQCTEARGIFQLDTAETDIKLVKCLNDKDALSHSHRNIKTSKTFFWTPRATDAGHVYVRATVVQSERVFWNTLRSEIIYQGSNDGTAVVSCPVPSTFAAANEMDGSGEHREAGEADDHHSHGEASDTGDDHSYVEASDTRDHHPISKNVATTAFTVGVSVQNLHVLMTLLFLAAVCFNML